MNELLQLKRNAQLLGLCGEYRKKWDEANSKQELMRLATDANGIEFMADGVTFGWGLTPSYLVENFSDCINGEMLLQQNGYTSEMYVNNDNMMVTPRATATIFIGCDGVILIPKCCVRKIYVCAHSRVTIENEGICELVCYGKNEVTIRGDGITRRKDVSHSEWKK